MVSVSKIIQAGGKKIADFGEPTSAKVFGGEAPDETITKLDSGDLLIKSMEQDEVETLNDIIRNQGYKGPDLDFGLDMNRIGSIFNSDDQPMLLGNLMSRIAAQNKDLFSRMKRGKQSMDDLMVLATQAGVDKHMYDFLKLNPGGMLPPESVTGGIIAIVRLTKELEHGARLILEASDDMSEAGQARLLDLYKKQKRLGAIQANLSAKVSGVVSEYGRGMATVRHMSSLEGINIKDYSQQLSEFMQGWDAQNIDFAVLDNTEVQDIRVKMLHLLKMPNPSKAKFANKLLLAKTYDMAMEVYINALLSSPVSHSVNIAGNGVFQVQTLIERGVAGIIGEFRSKMIGGANADLVTDRVYMGEVAAEAHGLAMAQKDAAALMFRTFITGESGTLSSKIELRNMTTIGKENNLGKIIENAGKGDFNGMFFDIMGVATRMPGRFLASEDEFFKVLSMQRVKYREAYSRASTDYRIALRAGKSREEAKQYFEATYVKIMHDTPDDVQKLMTAEAKEMTFQRDLSGVMGVAGKIANYPLFKPVVPFFKTPANIVQNVWDRSFNPYPIIESLRKGSGREFDEAMSKLVTGWGVMTLMYNLASGVYGDNLIITGKGPTDRKAKKMMSDKGIQPYSIGFKKDDGTYDTYTFSRLDPMSGLLAMAADMAYYMRDADMASDPNFGMAMLNAATLSAASYATNMPFLQGLSEIMDAAGNVNAGEEKVIESILKFTGKKVGDVGMAVSGSVQGRMTFGMGAYVAEHFDIPWIGATSFSRAMERYNDPTASNTMPPNQYILGTYSTDLNPMFQGFYSAVQAAKAGHPRYSSDLPPALDFWGNKRQTSEGVFEEFFNPIRVKHGAKLSRLDNELIRLSERGGGTFSFHRRNINGVKLSAEEYNYYVKLINQIDNENRHITDRNYDESTSLLNMLNSIVDPTSELSAEYYDPEIASDYVAQYNILSAEVSQRRKKAREILIENTPRLRNIFEMEY